MSEINPTEVMDTLEGLAVIGMAGCFPGARTIAELWGNLVRGVESISTFSEEEILAAGVDRSC
jgi:acyl transferase domain-containing protein